MLYTVVVVGQIEITDSETKGKTSLKKKKYESLKAPALSAAMTCMYLPGSALFSLHSL